MFVQVCTLFKYKGYVEATLVLRLHFLRLPPKWFLFSIAVRNRPLRLSNRATMGDGTACFGKKHKHTHTVR